MSPRMTTATGPGGGKAAVTGRDHVRTDVGDTRMSESPQGHRVGSVIKGNRKRFGSPAESEAGATAELWGDSGRVRVAVRVRIAQLQ